MKWLLFGGAGFTGRYLVKALREKFPKDEILIADILSFDDFELHQFKCDVRYSNQIYRVLRDTLPDYIINLVGIIKPDDILTTIQINSLVTAYIGEFYKKNLNSIRKILIIGSASQYGKLTTEKSFPKEDSICNPTSIYGWTKLLQERIGLEYYYQNNIPFAFTRTANLLGPGLSDELVVPTIINQIVAGKLENKDPIITLRNINAGRDFIDVRDAIEAYIKIITSNVSTGQIYNIGSGRITMLKEIISIIQKLIGNINIIVDAKKSETPDIHALNCAKINQTLSWFPKIGLSESLNLMVNSKIEKITI